MLLLSRKKIVPFLTLVLCTILAWSLLVVPELLVYGNRLNFYIKAFNTADVTITLDNDGIKFQGDLPYMMDLGRNIEVIFSQKADSSQLASFGAGSILFSPEKVLYKTNGAIKSIGLSGAKADHKMTFTPQLIYDYVKKYFWTGSIIIIIASFILLFIGLNLLAFFAAGLGSIIDAFGNGPFEYKQLLSLATFIMFFWIMLAAFFRTVHYSLPMHGLSIFLMFFATVILFSYVLVKNARI